MKKESKGPDVVSLDAYRLVRTRKALAYAQEVVTDVHFSITRSGVVLPAAIKVFDLHSLAVVAWCLDLSSNMLDSYISSAH
jgi:hypothetical protein